MDSPIIRGSEADVNEIARFVRLLFLWFVVENWIIELRVKGTGKGIVSGYFDCDHQIELIESAAYWSGLGEAVWFTVNPVIRDVHGRARNRMQVYAKDTTTDKEIACRRDFFIDIDSVKPPGVSATDAELAATVEIGAAIRDELRILGWPDPIMATSGNGCHMHYRIEEPNDDDTAARLLGALKAIKARFENAAVKIDTSVGNASRMCKLPGTKACKGDETPERPHRIAKLIEVPESFGTVTREQLESLAGSGGIPAPND
ncbi:MAG TPA: hypothetical protein VGM05_34610 [Planctomycetaceae bacterium]|jgi:hypothetical protein